MLIKKLGAIAATGALLLAVAAPAFADVSVNNNDSTVWVNSTTLSTSGSNTVSAEDESYVKNVSVTTGASYSNNTVGTELNNNTINVNNNTDGVPDVDVSNSGLVGITVVTGSTSGSNTVSAEDESHVENVSVTTGASTSLSNVQTLVNVNQVTVSGNEVDW